MKPTLFVISLGIIVSGHASRPALAATPTASFGVTATVQATCAVSVSTPALGLYSTTGIGAAPAVSVNCSNSIPYTVGLSGGSGIATVTASGITGADSALLRYALASVARGIPNQGRIVDGKTATVTRDGPAPVIADRGQVSVARTVPVDGSIIVTVTY